MAGTPPRKRTLPSRDGAARIDAVVRAFAQDERLAPVAKAYLLDRERGGTKKFGSNALKLNGKIFAMLSKGHLVVKLAKSRVDELVEKRLGEYFDPGHGRLMKQWVMITSDRCSWIDLAKEAYDFVQRAR